MLMTMMLVLVLGAAGPEPKVEAKPTKPVPRLAVVMKDIATLQEAIKKLKEDIERLGPGDNDRQPTWRLDQLKKLEGWLAEKEALSIKAAGNEAAAAVAELEADVKRLEAELARARARLAAAKKEF